MKKKPAKRAKKPAAKPTIPSVPRLYISICSPRAVSPNFSISVAGLVNYLGSSGVYFHINHAMNADVIQTARQAALNEALLSENNFTHILFIDDDIQFAPQALQSLLSRAVPVVGANYCHKSAAFLMSATGLDGVAVDSRNKTGVEAVDSVGLGFLLVELAPLRGGKNGVPVVTAPHFEVRWHAPDAAGAAGYSTSDIFFCRRIRDVAGVQVMLDHDASRYIGRIGEFTYNMDVFPVSGA